MSQLCESLVRLGVEVTVVTINANGNKILDVPTSELLDVAGVNVFYYPVKNIRPRSYFYSPELAKACLHKIKEFDLVILETFYTHSIRPSVIACKRNNVPYIISLRGQLLPWALQHKV